MKNIIKAAIKPGDIHGSRPMGEYHRLHGFGANGELVR